MGKLVTSPKIEHFNGKYVIIKLNEEPYISYGGLRTNFPANLKTGTIISARQIIETKSHHVSYAKGYGTKRKRRMNGLIPTHINDPVSGMSEGAKFTNKFFPYQVKYRATILARRRERHNITKPQKY